MAHSIVPRMSLSSSALKIDGIFSETYILFSHIHFSDFSCDIIILLQLAHTDLLDRRKITFALQKINKNKNSYFPCSPGLQQQQRQQGLGHLQSEPVGGGDRQNILPETLNILQNILPETMNVNTQHNQHGGCRLYAEDVHVLSGYFSITEYSIEKSD